MESSGRWTSAQGGVRFGPLGKTHIREIMGRHTLLIACLCLPLAAPVAAARDLWGDDGLVLAEDDVVVLTRTVRMTPDSRVAPLQSAEPRLAENELAEGVGEEASLTEGEPLSEEEVQGPLLAERADQATFENSEPDASSAPQPGRILTAPPIPGREKPGNTGVDLPSADEMAAAGEVSEGPDISTVEYFGGETTDRAIESEPFAEASSATDTDETQMASLPDDASRVPPSGGEPRRAPPQFDSLAFAGLFRGIGVADGMRLSLDLSDSDLDGWFVDSGGQNFRLDGQLTNMVGGARAIVISADQPVGYMDFQLTNLGLTALFVPLAQDLSPMAGAARQYEFLRTLSQRAQSALEAERAARESSAAGERSPSEPPQTRRDGVQETFPGD